MIHDLILTNPYLTGFITIIVIGILSAPGTLLRSIAVGFDIFAQAFFWNAPIGVTISSRAGLAARKGYVWPAKVINVIMFSSTHCEDAIAADIERARKALTLLEPND
jgi:hypothetical protein